MKTKKSHIVFRSQVILLVVGLITGFLSLTFGIDTLPGTSVPKSGEEGDQAQIEVVQAVDAITSSFHVSFQYQYFVMDVLPDEPAQEDQELETREPRAITSKAIKVLLSRIISPNAP